MEKNILQCLEETVKKFPNKIAFEEINREINYKELMENAKKIGTALSSENIMNKPVAIFIDKSISCLEAMLGVLYSGNFYTVLDTKSPSERINTILETLMPKVTPFSHIAHFAICRTSFIMSKQQLI